MSKSQEWGSSNDRRSQSEKDQEVEDYLEKQANNPLRSVRQAADERDKKGSKTLEWIEKLIEE